MRAGPDTDAASAYVELADVLAGTVLDGHRPHDRQYVYDATWFGEANGDGGSETPDGEADESRSFVRDLFGL